MTFDPVAYINTPRWQASRLGLDRIAKLLDRMGRPQDKLRFVHVAGTNGKGSTCAYVESVLRCAGYKTGLFTSPYIETFEERIRVNGQNIGWDDLCSVTLFVRRHAEVIEAETGDHPTEFELMTAVALEHFARSECDMVVLEVGLGGRLDSTNVIDAPEVCVIARIGLDHTALLGNTLAHVAAEKAGIVKPGATVVSASQDAEARKVIEHAALQAGCKLVAVDAATLEAEPLSCEAAAADAGVRRGFIARAFSYKGELFSTGLLGSYQPMNAALAVEVVEALRDKRWSISRDALHAGIAQAAWPGRFEVVAHEPLTIVDGGHNPQGAHVLADSLAEVVSAPTRVADSEQAFAAVSAEPSTAIFERGPAVSSEINSATAPMAPSATTRTVAIVMGVLADKDYRPMIRAVLPLASAFFTYAPSNPRALSASDLAAAIREEAGLVEFGALAKPVEPVEPAGLELAKTAAVEFVERAGSEFVEPVGVKACADAASAMHEARAFAGAGGIVVAFGSLYSIAELKTAIR